MAAPYHPVTRAALGILLAIPLPPLARRPLWAPVTTRFATSTPDRRSGSDRHARRAAPESWLAQRSARRIAPGAAFAPPWDSMRTSDPKVFATGDGAFGGSTLVMAMQHGQRAAYCVRHYLEGNRDEPFEPLPDISGNARPTSYKTPSMVRAPCMLHRGDRIHEYGNGGDPGLCDLPAIVVDSEVDVVALPCRKRSMAGRPSICPATLGNVNCPGRLVQPGGAAIFIHPFLYLLRNSNEPIRWTSMRASASSSGRSFIGMKLMKAS